MGHICTVVYTPRRILTVNPYHKHAEGGGGGGGIADDAFHNVYEDAKYLLIEMDRTL